MPTRIMKLTSERVMPNESGIRYFEHISRYKFAANYVKNKIVLDAACGSGYGSEILAKNAKKVIGIDFNENIIKFSANRYSKENVDFMCMNVENLSLADNTFDAIVSFETIEHIPDYDSMLIEFHRILKKDGLLIISTPNKDTFGCNLKHPFDKFHIKEFYLKEFQTTLEKANFSILQIHGQNVLKKLRRYYSVRCFIVKFPFLGDLISNGYQRMLISCGSKLDDYLAKFVQKILGTRLSENQIIISKNNLKQAIYFIAICRKP